MSSIQRSFSTSQTMDPKQKEEIEEFVQSENQNVINRNAGQAPPGEMNIESLRMKALYRLFYHISIDIRTSLFSIFNFNRLQALFNESLIIANPIMDQNAMYADTSEDTHLINVVEICSIQVGYAILRALAAIREFGSNEVRQMGFLAVISHVITLTDFVSLVSLILIETKMYLFETYKAVSVVKLMATQQEQILHKFYNMHVVPSPDILDRK